MPSYAKGTETILKMRLQELNEELEKMAPCFVQEIRLLEELLRTTRGRVESPKAYAQTGSSSTAIVLCLNTFGNYLC